MSSQSPGDADSHDDCHVSRRARRARVVWAVPALVLLVTGVGLSVQAATSQASQNRRQQQLITETNDRSFDLATSEISSSVRLALQRYDDLVRAAGAFVVDHPHASNADLRRWMEIIRAADRHAELKGLGIVVIVPSSGLGAFAGRAKADPVGPLAADGSFQAVPPGDRPFYCFLESLWGSTGSFVLPAGLDFCTLSIGATLLQARDSGTGALTSTDIGGGQQLLVVYTPVYTGGVVPATTAERQANFVAAIGTAVDPLLLLDGVAVDHPDFSVVLRYTAADHPLSFAIGASSPGNKTASLDLGGGWEVSVAGPAARPAAGTHAALLLLLSGLLTAVLLAALVYVLGTSRARALRTVGAKTDELRHQALHDALTGLPNRALIVDRLEQLTARAARNGTTAVALYIDLDEFKVINDTLGHDSGDELLVAAATRLRTALRGVDTVGRIGGDEFVALVDCADLSLEQPQLVAERVLEVLRQPFELPARPHVPLRVTTSVGVAISDGADSGADLLRNADFALYQAKAAGKDRYAVFDADHQSILSRRAELEFDARNALQGDEFELMYQPLYTAEALQPVAIEALLRWRHPRFGLIQPDQFIPILEQSGRIIEVGRWVLEQACQQTAQWNRNGERLGVSVNVAARQLEQDSIITHVKRALELSGLEADLLTIEITESALMRHPDAIAARLRELKRLGIHIAIDDFGTGYASLAYLQRFPADSIKIDRAFINAMTNSVESHALLRTLIQLGNILGLTTVAEGVETNEQLQALQDEHVDIVQGFLLARPATPTQIEQRLHIAAAEPTHVAAAQH